MDHPRACGENVGSCTCAVKKSGSPPRVRGKRPLKAATSCGKRITPARAGKTCRNGVYTAGGADHPRACGENTRAASFSCVILGSPPRVRGKPVHIERSGRRGRITPARAGKTVTAANGTANQTDHPRACGENLHALTCLAIRTGSPPRVRGKHDRHKGRYPSSGITPARAGKLQDGRGHQPGGGDHPRACGENWALMSTRAVTPGSPPRVRGKRLLRFSGFQPYRITPARAGKTSCPSAWACALEDHPRACGENKTRYRWSASSAGSPPRVRGKHVDAREPGEDFRITPARAGKTRSARITRRSPADHPRACGENFHRIDNFFHHGGSPPRVRGKRASARSMAAGRRITPARAGKTRSRRP